MKTQKFPILLTVGIPVALALGWLAVNSRAATETPSYTVVRTDDKVEVRDYPALRLATTPMEGTNMNGGFRRLFRFITGNNEVSQKIEMTSPVLIAQKGKTRTMSFIMPLKTAEAGVPKPADKDVTLGKVEAARYVVLRFPGGRSKENEDKAAAKLSEWMKAQGMEAKGGATFAYYDPPWTPAFLRRNEVLFPIDGVGEKP